MKKQKWTGERAAAMEGVVAMHTKIAIQSQKDRTKLQEDLVLRETVERENQVMKKILYGGNHARDIEAAGGGRGRRGGGEEGEGGSGDNSVEVVELEGNLSPMRTSLSPEHRRMMAAGLMDTSERDRERDISTWVL